MSRTVMLTFASAPFVALFCTRVNMPHRGRGGGYCMASGIQIPTTPAAATGCLSPVLMRE